MSLEDLLKRVEAATGPDRKLDAAIAVALLDTSCAPDDLVYHLLPMRDDRCEPGTFWRKSRSGASLRTSEKYTSSLDSALALVEEKLPGVAYRVQRNLNGDVWASLQRRSKDGYDVYQDSPTQPSAPLAVLSALLRALISQKEGVE